MGPYFLTHRCVFSTFSQEQVNAKAKLLKSRGIETMIKAHNSNQQTGAMLQLHQYQIAYDLFVPNKDYDQARAILG